MAGRIRQEDLDALLNSGQQEESASPESVAEMILDGVRRNDAYIITHPESRGRVEQRFNAILAAFDRAAERRSS